jgi:flavin-binding protein dodecin
MAVMKVIELLAQSPKSWEDAAQSAIDEAGKTIRNIQSVYVKNFMCEVEGGRITNYRVNINLTFRVDTDPAGVGGRAGVAGAPRAAAAKKPGASAAGKAAAARKSTRK